MAIRAQTSRLRRVALTVPRSFALWFAYNCNVCGLGHFHLRVYPDASSAPEDSDDEDEDAAAYTDYEINWEKVYEHIADHYYRGSNGSIREVTVKPTNKPDCYRFKYQPNQPNLAAYSHVVYNEEAEPLAKFLMFDFEG